jgi:hypothetical protein
MDSTRIDSLLHELDDADPADAPDLAEAVARVLAHGLDAGAEH